MHESNCHKEGGGYSDVIYLLILLLKEERMIKKKFLRIVGWLVSENK